MLAHNLAKKARVAGFKRLLANMSHELRTPLDVIIGYSESSHIADETNERQHIHKSAEHLKRLINDLLDLSRAEVNELDLTLEMQGNHRRAC